MSKSKSAASDKGRGGERPAGKDEAKAADSGWRETVESIAMAVILALLFRGFVAEAFVIPTGSMAPTLRGLHKDVECPECGLWYQVGASQEMGGRNPDATDSGIQTGDVISGTCPSCRFTRPINRFEWANDDSFDGDRIIVSKFLYDFAQPKRWDVIVFKFPGNATQNYIKRLIGLPNETVRIQGGNIWIRQGKDGPFEIARKPADKLDVLLQLVNSTDHLSQRMLDGKWPLPWIEGMPLDPPAEPRWKSERAGRQRVVFSTDGTGDGPAWLRFRQLIPTEDEWLDFILANPPARPESESQIADIKGSLVVDSCHYNTGPNPAAPFKSGGLPSLFPESESPAHYRGFPVRQNAWENSGTHWVDDLAVECLADVQGESGALLLDLVRAGVHHQCRIDVASGEATLTRLDLDGQPLNFGLAGKEVASVKGQTPVRGAGSYRLKLYNCDHQVLLRVNGREIAFDGPTTYESPELVAPRSQAADYGDLTPVGIAAEKVGVRLSEMQVFRDVYYIAQKNDGSGEYEVDQILPKIARLEEFLRSPRLWTDEAFLAGRGHVEFELGPDQFFPLGDNSPASQDARTWPRGARIPTNNYVERDLLIGKAMFVYWPHT
ncbi:MAG TPA: signal peptidase I, partial [Pirellulaceae bacterium]|nr:signal peptidase I [Pirellulaceae bacterium]